MNRLNTTKVLLIDDSMGLIEFYIFFDGGTHTARNDETIIYVLINTILGGKYSILLCGLCDDSFIKTLTG